VRTATAAKAALPPTTTVGAAIRTGRYVPGVVSGVLLYLPLSGMACAVFARAGFLSARTAAVSVALGLLYQAMPVTYLVLRR
jgi:hypothetical protein